MDDIIFATVCVNINSGKKNYIEKGIKLINSIINNSKFPLLVLTNEPDKFVDYQNNSQIIIKDTNRLNLRVVISSGRSINMHLKRHSMELASNYDCKYIVYLDCDGYLTDKWNDDYSVNLFDDLDADVYRNKIYTITTKRNKVNSKGQAFLWKESTEFLWDDTSFINCHAPQETHIVFKNNEKFKVFNEVWKQIENVSYEINKKTTNIGFVIGIAICKSKLTNCFYNSDGRWKEYFKGFGLNNLGKEVKIISGVACD